MSDGGMVDVFGAKGCHTHHTVLVVKRGEFEAAREAAEAVGGHVGRNVLYFRLVRGRRLMDGWQVQRSHSTGRVDDGRVG
jgi:hypothetical protein